MLDARAENLLPFMQAHPFVFGTATLVSAFNSGPDKSGLLAISAIFYISHFNT